MDVCELGVESHAETICAAVSASTRYPGFPGAPGSARGRPGRTSADGTRNRTGGFRISGTRTSPDGQDPGRRVPGQRDPDQRDSAIPAAKEVSHTGRE
ncbi:hypothetical protein GCM10010420_07470 [Streptomyces glaucosporus]|uniref:Uncharacterized protein n=1 Tax=Streptomyces glaucosporus TaxID=284044 RepID=A0ABP5USN6_9ACTN